MSAAETVAEALARLGPLVETGQVDPSAAANEIAALYPPGALTLVGAAVMLRHWRTEGRTVSFTPIHEADVQVPAEHPDVALWLAAVRDEGVARADVDEVDR